MAVLDRQAILAATLRREQLDVPELGGSVWVSELTAGDRLRFSYPFGSDDPKVVQKHTLSVHARFAQLVLVDEDGERLFKENDVPKLQKLSAAALQRVFAKGMELSKMGDNLDEIVGNSKGPAASTSSD